MADKTATSGTFPGTIGDQKSNFIVRTNYKEENGAVVGATANGSPVGLWQQISADEYNNSTLPSGENGEKLVIISGGTTLQGELVNETRKYYKLVGEYNTDGSKKWSTTTSTSAELTNQMVDYNNGKKNDLLSNALNASEKSIEKQASVDINKAKEVLGKASILDRQTTGATEFLNSTLSALSNAKLKAGTRNSKGAFGGLMIYPEGLGQSDQDRIKIDMIRFNPRSLTAQNSGFADRTDPVDSDGNKEIIGSVVLAIPGGIRDDNRVNWGSADMNAAQAKFASLALNSITSNQEGISNDFDSLTNSITGDSGERIKLAIGIGLAGAAVGAQGLLARTTGAIVNPNTELLFNGPTLRAFSFQFPFAPRTDKEAKMVQRIIRFFKQGMAVQRTEDSIFLKAPNVFKLKYLKANAPHEFLPKIKTCGLLNCSVDYTPDGNYSTYNDGSMTKYTMTLTFNELDPLFNDEYGGNPGEDTTDIGY